MNPDIDTETLERIFSDAHVKDVDFSEWDQQITVCVLADHYRDVGGGRLPVLLVQFLRVSDFRVRFNHLDGEPLEDGAHYQWLVDSSSFEKGDAGWTVRLSGSLPAAPSLELTCEGVSVEEIEPREVDRACPDWDRPYQGLARAGISKLIRSRRRN